MRRTQILFLGLALAALPASLSAQLTVSARAADISVGGLFQTQYTISSVDGSGGGADAVDDVFIRRARINLDLRVGALDARIEPDFGGRGAGVGLADLYARLTFGRPLRVSVGQFKRAFSLFELSSDTDLPFIERDARIEGLTSCPGVGGVCTFSRLAARLQFDERDMGLRAEGDLGSKVTYMVTLTNGEGRNAADVNDAKSVSGRATVALTPRIRLAGFGGSHDYLSGTTTRRAGALGADVEVGTWRRGLHVIAGVIGGDNWLASTSSEFLAAQSQFSWYAALPEGGRFVGIEPMLRVDRSAAEDAAGVELSALTLTPGLALYVAGKNWLGLNLDHYNPARGDSEWSFKTQLYFYY